MVEYSLDDFGIPKKKGVKSINGIKKSNDLLKKFSEDYGPISEYSEILKTEGNSRAYDEFQKDYFWLENHIGKIGDFMYKELGINTIRMSTYFIELKKENHDCVQMNFPYENTVLNFHRHGPNFALYFTSPIKNNCDMFEQNKLLEIYSDILFESIPLQQLKHINWIEPLFISNYALDGDPHLTLQMELNLEGIKKDKSGIYADLFIEKEERFPFFPFQPVFAGKDSETSIALMPKEEIFDIENLRQKIAKRININQNLITNKRYDLEISIEDLKYSIGFRTIHDIRIKHKNTKEISEELINDFIRMTQEGLRDVQNCAVSDYVKGKDSKALEKGLTKRIIDSYKYPSFVNYTSSIFGPPEELCFFDDKLRSETHEKFKCYKKKLA